MVLGNDESTTTTKLGELLEISIAMVMQQYDAGRIARWSTSRASLEATGCRHRSSVCAVSSKPPPWSKNSNETHKQLLASNYGTF
jgi:hypothetical protein